MTPEQTAADVNARVARALIRAMGMQAENLHRHHRDETVAYTEQDFVDLIDEEGIGHNPVILALINC